MTNYSRTCPRCDGSGRYDRGTCFQCKGIRFVNQKTKPRGLNAYVLNVVYTNGKVNKPTFFASNRECAVRILSAYCLIKGWDVKEIV